MLTNRQKAVILTALIVVFTGVFTLAITPHSSCACGDDIGNGSKPKKEESLLVVIIKGFF